MSRLLPFLLIAFIFLSACSSTQTLTNCPQFKDHKKNKYLTKAFSKKNDKHKKRKQTKAEKVVKREQKQTKRINKLSQKVIKKLDKSSFLAKLEEMPQNQVEELYESLSKLKKKPNIFREGTNVALIPKIQKETVVTPIALLDNTQKINRKELADVGLLKRNDSKQFKKVKPKLFHEEGFVRTHGLAIAALVCGILSLVLTAIPFGILAIVFGSISKRKILEAPNLWEGKGMAQSGVIMGIVSLALTVLFILLALALAAV